MSYEKQTWATGDIVTADKLNHMEDGISAVGGGYDAEFHVTIVDDAPVITTDATYSEFVQKLTDGFPKVRCVLKINDSVNIQELSITNIILGNGEININAHLITVDGGEINNAIGYQIRWSENSLVIDILL